MKRVAVVFLLNATAAAFAQTSAVPASVALSASHSIEAASAAVQSDEVSARQWHLSLDEWARYRELMRGPLGVYSPGLDPLTALGIEARSEAERRRYAELQARTEAHRVEKLLAYQRAYDAASKRLFMGVPRIVQPRRSGQKK